MSVRMCVSCNKAAPERAHCTHSLVSDQVVLDGGAAVVLLDPFDLETVPPVVELGLQLGSAGFPWTGGRTDTESPGGIEVTQQGAHLFAFSFLARPGVTSCA